MRAAVAQGPARSDHGRRLLAGVAADLVAACRSTGVRDEQVLAAVRELPRAEFVSSDLAARAYEDSPLPIPHDQVTTQPSLVAAMVEALGLGDEDRVLEIGTGYGWQTGLLACLAAEVWSVERFNDLAGFARAALDRQHVTNATVVVGDGSEGLAEHAPFDAIIVAAAFPEVPAPLAGQLAIGGRLVQPIGPGGAEDVTLFERGADRLERRRSVIGAHFVRLYGRRGFPNDVAPTRAGS